MANVLAFAETRGGELRKVAFEAVTAARKLADATGGGEVHVLLAGEPGIGGKAEQLVK
jgi:electron transfer flavoprotein alpha subunit